MSDGSGLRLLVDGRTPSPSVLPAAGRAQIEYVTRHRFQYCVGYSEYEADKKKRLGDVGPTRIKHKPMPKT